MLSLNVALLRYLRHVEDRRLLYFSAFDSC